MKINIINYKPVFYACSYIVLAALFSLIFYVWGHYLGISNEGVDSIYLSLVTITTLGFGDITPSTDLGKIIVSLEALFGIITIGLFLNSLSHAYSAELKQNEDNLAKERKETLRKALEIHVCLILDVFMSGNPFAWDKHAKNSASIEDVEDFARNIYKTISAKNTKVDRLQIKALLETVDQNYDTFLSLTPVAAEVSTDILIEWSSIISNVRNLRQQYQKCINNVTDSGVLNWPTNDDIALQVQEFIQSALLICNKPKCTRAIQNA